MSNAPAPRVAETRTTKERLGTPRVKVLLTLVEGADLDAARATVDRQVYEPSPELAVVGDGDDVPEDVETFEALEDAISAQGEDVDFLWILHSDARPRPDALGALVHEVERNEAALAGSKLLVAGTENELESVGSSTDVFGEPYTGLDEGEIDQQQYDVVREVAFVRSASMLVRRDLAQGLRGLDELLPPIAAGLDFSQRARLAGGRVISVPSSEVYHQGRCEERRRGWREQAGRLRAMLAAYRPLTLLWVIPYDLIVSIVDSIGSLLLLRWRAGLRHLLSWGWNLFHLPSTIGLRRRFRAVRALSDEELFRFQARGSVRLRETGSELSGLILSVFDDDQAIARGTRRIRGSPGIWGAAVAALIVFFGIRSLVFTGVPNIGFSFPFEAPNVALDRWLAGWNDSGLGSNAPVHPSVGLTGVASWAWFGAEGAARTLMTIAFGFLAVVGMGRLAGRLGFRGPGRYLSGLVLLGGPGTALLAGVGSWLALAGAAALPWGVRAAFLHPHDEARNRLSHYGWALLLGIPVAAFSPVLVLVPLLAVTLWKLGRGEGARYRLVLTGLLAATVAVPFFLSDPGWVLDYNRRVGLVVAPLWPILIAIAVFPLLSIDARVRRFGITGALLALIGLVAMRLPYGGPGIEEASLMTASFGLAIVVAAGLERLSTDPRRLMASLVAVAVVLISIGGVANGRLGLPSGDVNERLGYAATLADEHGPGRILMASADRGDIPGEARAGPGFWYRLVDGTGTTSDEVWLPEPLPGDDSLGRAMQMIATGSELRPGELLAPYAIDWVVLEGDEFSLDEALDAQLDLIPTPLDPGSSRVYQNPAAARIADAAAPSAGAGTDSIWTRSGAGFTGDPGPGRVTLAINYGNGWRPDPGRVGWETSVAASDGSASFAGSDLDFWLAVAGAVLLVGSLLFIGVGRARR